MVQKIRNVGRSSLGAKELPPLIKRSGLTFKAQIYLIKKVGVLECAKNYLQFNVSFREVLTRMLIAL